MATQITSMWQAFHGKSVVIIEKNVRHNIDNKPHQKKNPGMNWYKNAALHSDGIAAWKGAKIRHTKYVRAYCICPGSLVNILFIKIWNELNGEWNGADGRAISPICLSLRQDWQSASDFLWPLLSAARRIQPMFVLIPHPYHCSHPLERSKMAIMWVRWHAEYETNLRHYSKRTS